MNSREEISYMQDSIKSSAIMDGMAMTPAREKMLERDLTVVRIIGGYKNAHPNEIDSHQLSLKSLSSLSVAYTPRGSTASVSSALVPLGLNCFLLPEALGKDGYIHVSTEHGMNLGILVARAKSPLIYHKQDHFVPGVSFDRDFSTVNDSPFIYGEGRTIYITGENTFLDVLPGRISVSRDGIIEAITEMIANKSKKSDKPDMHLTLYGQRLPERFLDYQEEYKIGYVTRGISLGKTVNTHIPLEESDFKEDIVNARYDLDFIFD